jgi:hypothetical protein
MKTPLESRQALRIAALRLLTASSTTAATSQTGQRFPVPEKPSKRTYSAKLN